jgi:ABC-type transport system involved in multi-copper enzyme maturation permease subunit
MTGSIRAELLILRRRSSTWILLGLWTTLALVFAYAVPYATYRDTPADQSLAELLPQAVVANTLVGFPFFGGVFALMLGVLSFGSEFGWGTLKTIFTQRPPRLQVFGAKLVALAVALVPFVLAVFVAGLAAGTAIGLNEGTDLGLPSAWLLLRGLAAGWLVLAVWGALGVLLAVLSRGTALAIGVGILYALVIEGLLSALSSEVSLLDRLVEYFLRANAYSLVERLGVSAGDVRENGPGSFEGPFVGGPQAVLALTLYAAVFLGVAGWVLRRRDVT